MKKRKLLGIMVACMLMLVGCGQSEADTSSKDAKNEEKAQTEATVDSSEATADSSEAVADSSQAAAQQEETGDAESEKEVLTEGKNEAETMEISTEISTDILVVYFSRTGEQYGVGMIDKGNTAIVADMIIEQTGADAFEILPQEDYYPYTYDKLTDVAKKELNDKARPAYAGEVPDLSQYSTIFIGAPVWWGDWPMILYTFLKKMNRHLPARHCSHFQHMQEAGFQGLTKSYPGHVRTVRLEKGSLSLEQMHRIIRKKLEKV